MNTTTQTEFVHHSVRSLITETVMDAIEARATSMDDECTCYKSYLSLLFKEAPKQALTDALDLLKSQIEEGDILGGPEDGNGEPDDFETDTLNQQVDRLRSRLHELPISMEELLTHSNTLPTQVSDYPNNTLFEPVILSRKSTVAGLWVADKERLPSPAILLTEHGPCATLSVSFMETQLFNHPIHIRIQFDDLGSALSAAHDAAFRAALMWTLAYYLPSETAETVVDQPYAILPPAHEDTRQAADMTMSEYSEHLITLFKGALISTTRHINEIA